MCGICGVVNFDGRPVDRERLGAMTAALFHRGPDDEGLCIFPQNGAANAGLGFRRLSIIDVAGGHQPMRFGNLTIVFNGEIYNYRELRAECEKRGERFTSTSDTEVLLHLYKRQGRDCLGRLNGMFAFAVWDEEKKELFLARDRMGIKPLYYFAEEKRFVFASEMKSLLKAEEIPALFDPRAVFDFYLHRFVPGPQTILQGVKKLLPGHFLLVSGGGIRQERYWRLPPPETRAGEMPPDFSSQCGELLRRLEESVRSQLVSDVPLGAFLSGGVDSSLVTALMAKNSKEKVKTFSIGFEKSTGVDESPFAREVSRFLGTEHHEIRLGEEDLKETESILGRVSEPVADPTILPTAILSRFARKEVKVVLTGEGGDELFAGYNRYKALHYAGWVKRRPQFLQPLLAAVARRSGRGDVFRAIPGAGAHNWFELNRDFEPEVVRSLLREGFPEEETGYLSALPHEEEMGADSLNAVLDLESRTALVDRLLMKVDSGSMGESLEARPPYLDHRLVEFAFQIPGAYKVRRFQGKYILRKAAETLLPAAICRRRKHGFIVPLQRWVQAASPLWLREVLDDGFFRAAGIFNREAVQKRLENIYNEKNAEEIVVLWPMIVLACWLRSLKKP